MNCFSFSGSPSELRLRFFNYFIIWNFILMLLTHQHNACFQFSNNITQNLYF
eukprot:UN04560